MAEQWLSIAEYARVYNLSDMTVRRRVKTGKLRAVLQNGKYFIPVTAEATSSGVRTPDLGERRSHIETPSPVTAAVTGSARMPAAFPANDMVIIKGQAMPPRPYMPPPAAAAPQAHASVDGGWAKADAVGENIDANSGRIIPASLRQPLTAQSSSLVDTRALLAYCEASLRKVTENERRTVEKFKSKLDAVEAQLAGRDMEVKILRQQVEDLQLLVKILQEEVRSSHNRQASP